VSIKTLTLPGTNQEGFAALSVVQGDARARSLEAFQDKYPAPALQIADITVGQEPSTGGDATVRGGAHLLTELQPSLSAFRYMEKVGFLVKRPGNPFPQFVCVGRAANNDLVIAIESISKFHGYFTVNEGRWSVTDFRSTNGTELNGEKLMPNMPAALKDGDQIRFGKDVRVLFLGTEALYNKLRGR
jgi:hypothetical protein